MSLKPSSTWVRLCARPIAATIGLIPVGLQHHRAGERRERGWREEGERMERGWREDGERMERGWREDAERMERGCREDGERMERGWCGVRMAWGAESVLLDS
eukprot:1165552-Rhodomonas_salina.3